MGYNFKVKRPDGCWDTAFNISRDNHRQALQVALDHFFYDHDNHVWAREGRYFEFHVRREDQDEYEVFNARLTLLPLFDVLEDTE